MAFYLTEDDEQGSRVQFGGYDLSYASEQDANITWNSLINKDYWTLKLSQATYGDLTFELSTKSVIVDSGTSYFLMPSDEFD
jgi:hypothetical protein